MSVDTIQAIESWYDDEPEECTVCGSSVDHEPCWVCHGEGEFDLYEEDPLWYEPGDVETCPECDGMGYLTYCLNAPAHRLAESRA